MSDNFNQVTRPPLGVIEGFFGRPWSTKDRIDYANFLAQQKLNFYIYAPKGDAHLRRSWQLDWPTEEKQQLLNIREAYQHQRIDFGIGLSPFEIYLQNTQDQKNILRKRVQQINALNPDILCILFDDMRGDIPSLAELQTDLVHLAAETSTAKTIIFCPTYYCFDPVLEKVFGTMPNHYWNYLGTHLDSSIKIFWTGEKVCSSNYSRDHLTTINQHLKRKVFLWDNYPVNDSAIKSNFIYLNPVSESHSQISDLVSGHAMNPMNQAQLSKFSIASLSRAYDPANDFNQHQCFNELLTDLCPPGLIQPFKEDIKIFEQTGLKNLLPSEKSTLIEKYSSFQHSPFGAELIAWLNGEYTFDPACLTE